MVMFLGIASIIGVLIYKSVSGKESAEVEEVRTESITHSLNAGETVREMVVENGVVYLLVDGQGMTSVLQIDRKDGAVTRRVDFIPQAN